MFIGDSTVLGYSVPQDKTVSAQHQQLFQRKGLNVEIINAGVEGYGTDQSLLLMERLIPLYHPDIVIYGLCQNDFGENQTREVHGQAKPIFKITHNGNAEMTPPVLKDKIYSGGSGIRKWIQYIALYRLLQPSMFKLRVKLFGWHNSKNGVTDDLDKLYVSPETLEAIDWNLFRYLLNRMKVISNTNGAQFLFYSHPALQEVWDPYIKNIEQNLGLTPGQYDRYVIENKLIKISNEENIVFIPMIDWFLKHSSEGPFHLLPRDPHCNSNGYRLIAERLSPYLSQLIIKNDASRN
jgi:lysophospholipase L1-like esterase